MEDIFDIISHIARMEDRNKVCSEPNFKPLLKMSKEWVQEVSTCKYTGKNPTNKTYNGSNHRSQNNVFQAIGKYKLKTMDLTKKYKDKFRQAARKWNIIVSEVPSVLESTYLEEHVKQLLGNLRLSDIESD